VRWVIDGRTIPQLGNSELISRIEGVLGESTRVERKAARFDVWSRDPGDELIQCAMKANPQGEVIAFGGVSDAFWNRTAQGVIMGPGHSHQSHQADEWIEEAELLRGYELYKRTAELFLG